MNLQDSNPGAGRKGGADHADASVSQGAWLDSAAAARFARRTPATLAKHARDGVIPAEGLRQDAVSRRWFFHRETLSRTYFGEPFAPLACHEDDLYAAVKARRKGRAS